MCKIHIIYFLAGYYSFALLFYNSIQKIHFPQNSHQSQFVLSSWWNFNIVQIIKC